jgi:HSP20 family protein
MTIETSKSEYGIRNTEYDFGHFVITTPLQSDYLSLNHLIFYIGTLLDILVLNNKIFKNMTLVKFKPVSPMFSDVLNDFFNQGINESSHKLPAVNISEDANSFKIELVAPGISKEDFKINLEKDVLSISTEKKSENKEEAKHYSRKEFSYHSFKRSFTLPENVDKESISAQYVDGILHLTIAKVKKTEQAVKTISIS